jgi:hypothetical protein
MAPPSSLARNAKILRFATYAGLVLVVAATLIGVFEVLLGSGVTPSIQVATGADADRPGLAAMIVLVATGTPFALALWELSRMLGRAEQGEIFSQPTITHLRRFALLVLITAAVSICLPPVLAIATALGTGRDLSEVTLSFDGGDIFILLVSALLFFVSRLFEEAQRIADENRQIV